MFKAKSKHRTMVRPEPSAPSGPTACPTSRARRAHSGLMSSSSSSAILSDALSVLSKTTHQIIADVEARARTEVARAVAEANEARHQRDKALKDLHAAQIEAEAARREGVASKAAVRRHAQAELTITHQLDTISQQLETIEQLRREVNQWKDQSKNWQDHFLRVEQDRCALSSRIEELVSEQLLWSRASGATTTTPRSRLADSTPLNKRESATAIPSPTHPPQTSTRKPTGTSASKPPARKATASNKAKASSSSTSAHPRTLQLQQQGGVAAAPSSSGASSSSPNSPHTPSQKQGKSKAAAPTIRQSTVIRRVHAVVRVKREEDSDEEPGRLHGNDDGDNSETYVPGPPVLTPATSTSTSASSFVPSQEESQEEPEPPLPRPSKQRSESRARRRRSSRMIVEDEYDEDDESEDQTVVARNLRAVRSVNYQESDDGAPPGSEEEEEESDEDELMIRNPGNNAESTNTPKQNRRAKTQKGGPPTKKRKVGAKPLR
ncbi:hypothetical protein DFP72DRAFT_1044263 [Ephemerocybe angulata]|uniref:Uncharacterized protein n=1 Tax=Ephemerocybe angulata TaxID=980116 RepID=A0A8H6I3R7_9AGAR|nr:hypothetical protein DFP72DRAFT_1044263 [Tulosesus angulatus]